MEISKILLDGNTYNIKDSVARPIDVNWNWNSDIDSFKTPGVYDIYGERTNSEDNLPINNASSGHSISAKLFVLASTLQPANNEICITQVLMLSNRLGGEGNMYIRTYNENNGIENGWSVWGKLQTNIEVGLIDSTQLREFIDNGIYSGVVTGAANFYKYDGAYFKRYPDADLLIRSISGEESLYAHIYYAGNLKYQGIIIATTDTADAGAAIIKFGVNPYSNQVVDFIPNDPNDVTIHNDYNSGNDNALNNETFVLVNINNYAIAGAYSTPRLISQFKYGVDILGNVTFKKRAGKQEGDRIVWEDWSDLNSGQDTPKLNELPDFNTLGFGKYHFFDTGYENFNSWNIDNKHTNIYKSIRDDLENIIIEKSGIEMFENNSYLKQLGIDMFIENTKTEGTNLYSVQCLFSNRGGGTGIAPGVFHQVNYFQLGTDSVTTLFRNSIRGN
jgi:hypothetical protein